MFIVTSKNFDKKFRKLTKKLRLQTKTRILIFLKDQLDPILNNHQLHGEKKLIRSINITGDLRILYEEENREIVRFLDIDTHSNLY